MDWDNRKHFQVELLLNVYLQCCHIQDKCTVAGYRLASIKIYDTSGNIKRLPVVLPVVLMLNLNCDSSGLDWTGLN
jgi:hypothetical protein